MAVASKRIRVLIVDDSAMVRKMIADALSGDPEIEVVGAAPDPYIARDMIVELNPDVLTLDIEMPRMDGLTFLKILQKHKPMPVVVISSISQAGSSAALEALHSGAVEVLAKPSSSYSIGHLAEQLPRHIKAAAQAKLGSLQGRGDSRPSVTAGVGAQERGGGVSGSRSEPAVSSSARALVVPAQRVLAPAGRASWNLRQIVLLGASTGGIEALTEVLTHLPAGLPPICITQHMPAHFSRMFAQRVSDACAFPVSEAADGQMARPGAAYVAPGDYHMTLRFTGAGYRMELNQKPPVHHCRPSVDVMFRSVAEIDGARVSVALLTGMGMDGALGMKLLKGAGAKTIAQNEETCVVYGMPRAAVELGVVDRVLPLKSIAQALVDAVASQEA
jgi:two-component system chemotaxis response regulator CheB